MTVKIEAFLAIEQGMAARLKQSWRKIYVRLQKQLEALAANGEWEKASRLIDTLDLSPLHKENEGHLRYMSYAALLFGASRLSKDVKSSMVARGDMEPVLKMTLSRLRRTINEQMRPMLQQILREDLTRIQNDRSAAVLNSIQKWDPSKHPRHPSGAPSSQGGQFREAGPLQGDLLLGDFEPAPHMDLATREKIDFTDDIDWDIDNLEDGNRGHEVIEHYTEKGLLEAFPPPPGASKHMGTMYVRWEKDTGYVYTVDDEGWATRHDFADFVRENAEDAYPDLEETFNREFWESPPPLYHATPEDRVEFILEEGIEARHDSRGMHNRHITAAVFTGSSWEAAERNSEIYGPMVFEIDTEAMKRDGFMPFAFQEPDVVERDREGALANHLGDDEWEGYSEQGEDEETVILDAAIPAKYLKLVTERTAKIAKREQVRKYAPDQPRGKSTPQSRGGSFRKNHILVVDDRGLFVRGWSPMHQQIIGNTLEKNAKRFASKEAFIKWVSAFPGASNTTEPYLDRFQFFDERDEAKPWEKVVQKFDANQPRHPKGTPWSPTGVAPGRFAKALSVVGGMGDPTGLVAPTTPEFRKWFGESVVVDREGEPLPAFHVTPADFDVFGVNRDNPVIDRIVGPHFAVDPRVSNTFMWNNRLPGHPIDGARMVPVYLSIQNPWVVRQVQRGTYTDVGGQPYESFEGDQESIARDIAEVVFSENRDLFIQWAIQERVNGGNWDRDDFVAQQRAGDIWDKLKAGEAFPSVLWESLSEAKQGDYLHMVDPTQDDYKAQPFGNFAKRWASFGMAWTPDVVKMQRTIVDEYKRILTERGYDGISYRNTAPMEIEGNYTREEQGWGKYGEYPESEELRFHTYTLIPFRPEQVKSVFNERPTDDERITKYSPDQARHPKGGVWASSGPAPGRFAPQKTQPMGEFSGVQLPLNEHGDPYITDHGSLTSQGLTGSTKEQVQAFMRWRYPDMQWDFDQFNPYVTNELAFEANNVLKRFPWLLNGLAGIKRASPETVKAYFEQGKGVWAVAEYSGLIKIVGFDLLVESKEKGADLAYEELRKGADRCRVSGYHPPNFTVGGIVTHEMGHVVQYMMDATYTHLMRLHNESVSLEPVQKAFVDAYSEYTARYGMLREEYEALDAGDEYYDRGAGDYFSGLSFPSSYATKNNMETFAEGFQEWVTSTYPVGALPMTTHHEIVPGRTRSMSLDREEGDGPTIPLKDRPARDNISIHVGNVVTAYDALQRSHFEDHPERSTWDQKFGETKTVPVRRLGDTLPRVPRE